MDLDKYTELANKILGNTDPEKKHKGLSNLIDSVAAELPDAITVEHRDLVLSNRKLRFDYFKTYILHQHDIGNNFRICVNLLNKHRDEVEQWECEDEATIADRKEKLKHYAQYSSIKLPPRVSGYRKDGTAIIEYPIDPNSIYCESGTYRKYDEVKNVYYYQLGRMIQTANADNGDLKKMMQAVCLMVALNNERSIVEDELRVLGIIPMAKTETMSKLEQNRQIQYYNITDLRESAEGYKMLSKYDPEFVQQSPEHYRIAEPIERLHNAIDELSFTDNGKLVIKTDEIRNVLDAYNPNQEHIAESLSNVIEVVTDLRDHVGEHMGALLRIDPSASNVFCFLNAIVPILETELQRVIERKKYAPTEDDEKAVKDKLIPFIERKYGDMSFDTFMSKFIINNVANLAKKRRLKYLIANCNDDGIKEQLRRYLEQCEMEVADHNVEQIPEPQPSPSTKATATKVAPPSPSVDAERLKPFFNSKFKGMGNNYNYFDDMVKDIENIKVTKELAMIAVMIYNCPSFIQRPSTFAAWLREFFEIIGRDCPKDPSKNKYKPSEKIQRMFHYLT